MDGWMHHGSTGRDAQKEEGGVTRVRDEAASIKHPATGGSMPGSMAHETPASSYFRVVVFFGGGGGASRA